MCPGSSIPDVLIARYRDGRQDGLPAVYSPQHDIFGRRCSGLVLLDLDPGRLAVQACPEGTVGDRPEGTEGAVRNLQALASWPTVSNLASTWAGNAPSLSSSSPGSGSNPSKRLQAKLSRNLKKHLAA